VIVRLLDASSGISLDGIIDHWADSETPVSGHGLRRHARDLFHRRNDFCTIATGPISMPTSASRSSTIVGPIKLADLIGEIGRLCCRRPSSAAAWFLPNSSPAGG